MPTNLTPRTKPTTNLTARTKPVIFALWTSLIYPWQISLPWQNTEITGGTSLTPRTKP